tara:strand:- start:790 stop:1467 length:678 start_codon:yes stop_codon:yes gene_type:complete
MSLIINHEANNKLLNYYKSDKISNSFKSMIHIIYRIQFPNKVWDLIKEFSIISKEQLSWCREAYKKGYVLRDSIILPFIHYEQILNKRTSERLNLSEKKISNVNSLANALETNTTLKYLNLYGNQISDVSALGKALETNTTLKVLYLSDNQISDVSALAKALETNTTLERLWLNGNQISDVSALGKVLETNTTLKELDLWHNKISEEDKKKLKAVRKGHYCDLYL